MCGQLLNPGPDSLQRHPQSLGAVLEPAAEVITFLSHFLECGVVARKVRKESNCLSSCLEYSAEGLRMTLERVIRNPSALYSSQLLRSLLSFRTFSNAA